MPGAYLIRNTLFGTYIDLTGDNEHAVCCWSGNGGSNQQWIMTQVGDLNQWQFRNVRFPDVFLAFDSGSEYIIASQTPSNWLKYPADKYTIKLCDSKHRYACGAVQGNPIPLNGGIFASGIRWFLQASE